MRANLPKCSDQLQSLHTYLIPQEVDFLDPHKTQTLVQLHTLNICAHLYFAARYQFVVNTRELLLLWK